MKTISEKAFFNEHDIDTSILFSIQDILKNKTKMVISKWTSAALWGFSDVMNNKIDLTVPKGYNPRLNNKEVAIKQRTNNFFNPGIIRFMFEDQEIKVYSPERTIVELIKEKKDNLNDNDINTFRNFFNNFKYDPKELKNMANKFNVSTEVNIIKKLVSNG